MRLRNQLISMQATRLRSVDRARSRARPKSLCRQGMWRKRSTWSSWWLVRGWHEQWHGLGEESELDNKSSRKDQKVTVFWKQPRGTTMELVVCMRRGWHRGNVTKGTWSPALRTAKRWTTWMLTIPRQRGQELCVFLIQNWPLRQNTLRAGDIYEWLEADAIRRDIGRRDRWDLLVKGQACCYDNRKMRSSYYEVRYMPRLLLWQLACRPINFNSFIRHVS